MTNVKGTAHSWPKAYPDKDGSKVVLMAEARGYVMVRRPGCAPFVMSVAEWNALAAYEEHTR